MSGVFLEGTAPQIIRLTIKHTFAKVVIRSEWYCWDSTIDEWFTLESSKKLYNMIQFQVIDKRVESTYFITLGLSASDQPVATFMSQNMAHWETTVFEGIGTNKLSFCFALFKEFWGSL